MSFKNISKSFLDALNKVKETKEVVLEYKDQPSIAKTYSGQLDELSKKTLKSYTKKATTDSQRAWDKADKEEDKSMATDGTKYPEKQKRHMDNASALIGRWRKRESGLEIAKKKLTKEEVENLEELSKDTLVSYEKKAKADPAFEKKRGPISATKKATQNKRIAGLERAAAQLSRIREKEFADHKKKLDATHDDLHNHFMKHAPEVLKKHGYTKMSNSESKTTWVRPHPSGHVNTVTILKNRDNWGGTKYHLGSSTGWGSGHGNSSHHSLYHVVPEEVKKTKNEMIPNFESKVIEHHNHYHMNEELENTSDVLSEAELDYISNVIDDEDFLESDCNEEALDEVSKKTLTSYHSKAKKQYDDEWLKGSLSRKMKNRRKMIDLAGTKKTEVEKRHQSNTGEPWDPSNPKVKIFAREDIESIEEGRGRPPKEGSAAWKRRQESNASDTSEPRQHIIQQLQRARYAMSGGSKVKFKDGSEHHISSAHASSVLDKYMELKPSEKEQMQKKISASHASFKEAL